MLRLPLASHLGSLEMVMGINDSIEFNWDFLTFSYIASKVDKIQIFEWTKLCIILSEISHVPQCILCKCKKKFNNQTRHFFLMCTVVPLLIF